MIRNINVADTKLLQTLASKCGKLDVHTEYTYWVICNYFSDSGFIIEDDNGMPMAFITSIVTKNKLFIWQIGVLPEYRGQNKSKELINKIIEYCKHNNINSIEVTIGIDNEISRKAFQSCFKMHGIKMVKAETIDINNTKEDLYTIDL